jgi:succinyl-diaminopimelate desuccinylase
VRARIADGRVHGPGATDMKGGLAVMLGVLGAVDPERLRFDLAAVFYDAEEGPFAANGLGRLLGEMPWLRDATLAVLLEPTAGAVELGCCGVLNAEVQVSGRRAHAARPWTGVNAVARAAPWLAEIAATPASPVTVDGVGFVETLQVTTLHAGAARNVLPDEVVANLNHRFPPDRTPAEAERRLRARVPQDFGFTVVDAAPAGKVCASHPEVAGFIRRFGLPTAGKQGWTDVARFTAAGIPAFNFGPGLPELCHAPEESCPIEHLGPACRMLAVHLSEEP